MTPLSGDLEAAERFFDGHPAALPVYAAVRSMIESAGPAEVRVSRSQVAFRRRRGFAYLWMPGRWLRNPASEVVLSLVLGRHHPSVRFKEVVNPSGWVWMHHLEVRNVSDLDGEVSDWIREAYAAAG